MKNKLDKCEPPSSSEPTFLRLRSREGSSYPSVQTDLIVETAEGQQIRGVMDLVVRITDDGFVVADLEVRVDLDIHAQLEGFALEPLATKASLEKVAEQRNAGREAAQHLRGELQKAAMDMQYLVRENANLTARVADLEGPD